MTVPDTGLPERPDEVGESTTGVVEGATDRAPRPRIAWIVGGALLILSVVLQYAAQWTPSTPIPLPLPSLAWTAGLLVFALARDSVTARRPLGTIALAGFAIWGVATAVVTGAIGRSLSGVGADLGALLVSGYVESIGSFLLALVAVIQIVRAGVVPRPWRWTPVWALAAVTATWVLQQLVWITAGTSAADLAGVLVALGGIALGGSPIVLGFVAITLGSGLLRTRPA